MTLGRLRAWRRTYHIIEVEQIERNMKLQHETSTWNFTNRISFTIYTYGYKTRDHIRVISSNLLVELPCLICWSKTSHISLYFWCVLPPRPRILSLVLFLPFVQSLQTWVIRSLWNANTENIVEVSRVPFASLGCRILSGSRSGNV